MDQLHSFRVHAGILGTLLRAELAAGIFGLRLFIACVVVAALMLGAVWMLGDALVKALERSGTRILGGDVAVSVVNVPLDDSVVGALERIGRVSRTVDLRTSAVVDGQRATVELKAVDDSYPLYGIVELENGTDLRTLLAGTGRPAAVVEPALLGRLGAEVGDTIRLGETAFIIDGVLRTEPDRLSSGRFMVGPRVIVGLDRLPQTGLLQLGSLVDFRYRIRLPVNLPAASGIEAVRELTPERGWELETPRDAGDRVRRTVERTSTFLGIAGIVALCIGLAGAWAAAQVWVTRRGRTIALYRLSGATPPVVVALHGVIIAIAGILGLGAGLCLAVAVTGMVMDVAAAQLHLQWDIASLAAPALQVALTLVLGLGGASAAALSGAARLSPGAAMRSGDAELSADPRHVAVGGAVIGVAVALAVLSLPVPALAATAAAGLVVASTALGLGGWALARLASRRQPRSFIGLVTLQGLGIPGAAATKAVAIGIGIAGITAILAAQGSLEAALRAELPDRIPDLVLIDVQPDQVEAIRSRIESDAALGALQASPFMRASIRAVNGVPAEQALLNPNKSWVIEGDRSFSWTAEPTGAELLAGTWWSADHNGTPLISAEEDVAEAFDLKPGDTLTYSVLGRSFTSEVANIRKEYHRTFRPEFLLVASPQPFRNAPHSWIMSLEGETDPAVDALIRDFSRTAPNVTTIDVRTIVSQVTEVIDGGVWASLAVAATLLVAGALSLTAVVAADVDGRRREALAFALVGASRLEIASARLAEAAGVGLLAATLGGAAGLAGGYWLVDEALRVAWAPGYLSLAMPLALGLLSALAAGLAGGLGAAPRGRGQMARQLAG